MQIAHPLSAAVFCLSTALCAPAQLFAQAAIPGYREHAAFVSEGARDGARFVLLEDERLTAQTRVEAVAAHAHGQEPCKGDLASPSAFCKSITQRALMPAVLALVDSRNTITARLPLERATAELSRVAVSRSDSITIVRVDLSADAGSYAGPLVRIPKSNNAGDSIVWAQVVNDAGEKHDLNLPTTLKTAWKADATAAGPLILLVACRPDVQHSVSHNADFVTTYSSLSYANGVWHQTDRRVPGIWENDGAFPERSLFPQ